MGIPPMTDATGFSSLLTVPIILVTFSTLCTGYVAYFRFLHPLAKFPGPLVCSLSNIWKFWAVATDRMPDEIVKLHLKYGPVVRIGPNDLSFNSGDAIADIYKSGWEKGAMYRGFPQVEPGLFSIQNEKLHAQRKRMFAPLFSMPAMRSMESLMDSRYAVLRRQLDKFAETGETFDLRRYITYCIVDILGELAFGGDFGNQDAEDPKKIPPVSEALFGSVLAGQIPSITILFDFLRDSFPIGKVSEVIASRDVLVPVALKAIKQREQKQSQREDMIGKLMEVREEKTGQRLTHAQVLTESLTLIFGGTHTTGNSLHILFANLSRNPRFLKRAVEEVDTLPPLKPTQAAYSMDGLDRLDFLNFAIKESHRRNTVGTFNMPRVVPVTGADIAGYNVPGGAEVFVNIHAVHHNPRTWGEDHNIYDPDRFYDERAKDLKDFVIPFGVGKRACAGQNLANINIIKMATTLLRAYEFDFVNVDEPMNVVCHGDSDLKTPLLVKCRLRARPFQG